MRFTHETFRRPLVAAAFALSACGGRGDTTASSDPSAMPSGVPAPAAGEFDAAGTEPFWSLKVRGDVLVLSRPGQADVSQPAPKPEAIGETLVWWGPAMNVSIMTRACNNGMSDRQYAYTAEVRIGDDILSGCAAKAGQTTPS